MSSHLIPFLSPLCAGLSRSQVYAVSTKYRHSIWGLMQALQEKEKDKVTEEGGREDRSSYQRKKTREKESVVQQNQRVAGLGFARDGQDSERELPLPLESVGPEVDDEEDQEEQENSAKGRGMQRMMGDEDEEADAGLDVGVEDRHHHRRAAAAAAAKVGK